MNDQVPGHYRAYRIALAALVLGLLAGAVWYLAQPGRLEQLLRLLRIEW